MDSTKDNANPYLALREAKIARNELRLKELGLLHQPSSLRGTGATSIQGQTSSKRKKVSSAEDSEPTILRRSSRHRGEEPASYQDVPPERSQRRTRARDEEDASSVSESDVAVRAMPPAPSPSSFPKNSARVFHLDVERLLLGTKDGEDGALGQSMERTGKAFVMEESARRAVSSYSGGPISFNKYSGVQAWGNNVMFLWINLNPPNSEVLNEFPGGGRQVTWYGGSRMHSGTPVIQQLIKVGKEAKSEASDGGVVLWCRQYLAEKRTFGPYVCFGRLAYESHEPSSQPLTFVWNLRDYDSLCNHKDKEVREVFHSMVTS
jgi:hypothetical protein